MCSTFGTVGFFGHGLYNLPWVSFASPFSARSLLVFLPFMLSLVGVLEASKPLGNILEDLPGQNFEALQLDNQLGQYIFIWHRWIIFQ